MSAKKQRQAARRKPDSYTSRTKPTEPRRLFALATIADTPLAAIVITLIVYIRCIPNDLVYDDHEMIVLNRFIGDWAMVWRSFVNDSWWFRNPLKLPQSAYYRPLQDVWLSLNYHMFGFSPAGWHIAMIGVHLIAVWLVFRITRELTDSRWTPIIAATLFGVLPIHAQAVVWPTAIPLPMSAVFELAAFLCFLRSRRDARASRLLAPVFYAMALLSHESAVMFPFLVAAYVLVLAPGFTQMSWRDRSLHALREVAPFVIEVVIYLGIRLWVLGFINRPNITNPMTRFEEFLTIPSAIGTYVVLLVAPWRAGPAHAIDLVPSMASREFYLPVLALLGLIGSIAFGLWNDSRRRFFLFWAIWIGISMVPVLNLRAFSPLALVEDRYLYLASAAWSIAIAELAAAFFFSVEPRGWLLAGATAIVTIACAAILVHVEGYWRDEIALFSTCAEMSPRSNLCHDRLGMALKQRGRLLDAEKEFQIAQEIEPEDGANLYNMGLVHVQMGRTEQALGELKAALAKLPEAPAGAYVEYAKFADSVGKADERDEALRHAEQMPGGIAAANTGRAELMIMHQDFAGAENLMRAAIAKDPRDADAWTVLGVSLVRQGRRKEALEAYHEADRIRPDQMVEKIIRQMEGARTIRTSP